MTIVYAGGPDASRSLIIDTDQKRIFAGGQELNGLSWRDYMLLASLGLCKDRLVTSRYLAKVTYGNDDGKCVRMRISKLRRIIAKKTNGQDFIKCIWHEGYMLRDPVSLQ